MSSDQIEGDQGNVPKQDSEYEIAEETDNQFDVLFRATDTHNQMLLLLLEKWMELVQLPISLSDADESVADELRHQVKLMLQDKTYRTSMQLLSVASCVIVDGNMQKEQKNE